MGRVMKSNTFNLGLQIIIERPNESLKGRKKQTLSFGLGDFPEGGGFQPRSIAGLT